MPFVEIMLLFCCLEGQSGKIMAKKFATSAARRETLRTRLRYHLCGEKREKREKRIDDTIHKSFIHNDTFFEANLSQVFSYKSFIDSHT